MVAYLEIYPRFSKKMTTTAEDVVPNFEQIIRDWLTEFKSLSKVSLNNYAENIMKKENVIMALHEILHSSNHSAVLELVQSGCHQLFEFYRSGNQSLQLFTICLFPSMVGAYLRGSSSCIEELSELASTLATFLLSIYNLICGAIGTTSKTSLFSENGVIIPDILHSSVYHDTMLHPFSERMLSMAQQPSNQACAKLPTPTTYSSITPSNRSKILYVIMSCYLDNISRVPSLSLSHVCKLCFRVACYGFPWQQMLMKANRSKLDRRIMIEPDLSVVILRCVYYALYNNHRAEAMKAIQAMQKRARYEISAQVLLVCNAILNTAYHEKSRVSSDAPLGIASTVTPMLTRTSSRRLRQAVTAKSIKHHKWMHANEEVSGDYTESLMQLMHDMPTPPSAAETTALALDGDDTSKAEKTSLSPAKLLKARIKKNVPFPSTSPSEKPRSLSIQTSEKKGKKSQVAEAWQEQRSRTPSGGQTVDLSVTKSSKLSSTSVPSLKQLSIEDSARKSVDRKNSITKGDLEIAAPKAHDPLISKQSDGANSTSVKKSKSDRRAKPNLKAGKEADPKKFEAIEKTKAPLEAVPLLDNNATNNADEGRFSHSTTV